MATLLLSAAGSAVGGSLGGSFAGMTTAALGKAAGASLGAAIDQRITGRGSDPVETGRVERFRVMGASEGAPLPRAFGRVRVAGQVIWSSRFLENVNTTRVRGKGGAQSQEVREFTYSVSLAVALCEGVVVRLGRVWADGQALDISGITWRLHNGSEDQLPDPVISAIEGADRTPAYRGTAYVVFENLDLTPFGNRVPQFNFEVFRRPESGSIDLPVAPSLEIRGVALVPGTGEYALATEPVYFKYSKGNSEVKNINNERGRPDFLVSHDQLVAELPSVKAVSLVVSWFGDDLRCNHCRLEPAVEQRRFDGQQMPWRVAGVSREAAKLVTHLDERPLFGGTPSDASVLQAIRHMNDAGQSVMFYPFILMDIFKDNGLPDPWSDAQDQPVAPWRGRMTLSHAPGRAGSPDKTPVAADQVAAFFGTARVEDFKKSEGTIAYSGPEEWSYRRFILHYAHLCAGSDGVDAFCIGSEMRALTQIRDGLDSYPAVRALCDLARDVRRILGPDVKIGYAADWSEYFGHHPADGSGDVLFHLDELWASPDIDFVGIDNYMPLSDWRDGSSHADAGAGSIYNLNYLVANVRGGEGYHWFYADDAARREQHRSPISDGSYGEDWVFRYKDIENWWSNPHFNRIGGVKASSATRWASGSKPIWFTELGCPAVDKGANQPNVFFDPKSSESMLPFYSNGAKDDYMQRKYLQAIYEFWNDERNNPSASLFDGRMINMDRAFVWAWDARPWPDFPDRLDTWVDGRNFARGHWLNSRVVLPSLDEVVAEVCERSGLVKVDLSGLHGSVTGYMISSTETARQSLQPLMLTFAFDSFGQDGAVAFVSRSGHVVAHYDLGDLAVVEKQPVLLATRNANVEAPHRVSLGFVRSDEDYQAGAVQAVAPDAVEPDTSQSDVPIVLSEAQAKTVAERWLSEGGIALDSVDFHLPLSCLLTMPGDAVSISAGDRASLFRIDRVTETSSRAVTAVRIEPTIYDAPIYAEPERHSRAIVAPTPVHVEFLDLPLLTGDEIPHAPHVAVAKTAWTGPVAVYSAENDFGYRYNCELMRSASVGETLELLEPGQPGRWMRSTLHIRMATGALQTVSMEAVLHGSNVAALRHSDTDDWEVFQYQNATLVERNVYELSGLLRRQAGTDGIVDNTLPAGADFVLLDGAVTQLNSRANLRGLPQHYRVGPASRSYDHPSYVHEVKTFAGVGLRPYKPAHLSARIAENGDALIQWIRRTRIQGDNWDGFDVPIGEDQELYTVKIFRGNKRAREAVCSETKYFYTHSQQMDDQIDGDLRIEVSQVSSVFGPGPSASLFL